MRFSRPKTNDTRIINKFLFIPLKLNNEIRWLERAKILQKFSMETWASAGEWENQKFID